MSVEIISFEKPFGARPIYATMPQGSSISDIIKNCGHPLEIHPHLHVTITMGRKSSVVPITQWRHVRPRAGAHVHVAPIAAGPALGALLTSVITAAAPSIATALGFTAGTFSFSLAVAGISIVGTLLVRALIPPPSQRQRTEDDPVFNITGQSNTATPYEPYPTILGRRLMFPKKTARGYTEGVDDFIYLRERMTFGYGPVALEELRIGTTPITDFDDVEIEFLNVDETLTLTNIPALAPMVRAWRQGTETMTLYPGDVTEDSYSVALAPSTAVSRQTLDNTKTAQVDISFNGLVRFDNKNRRLPTTPVSFDIEYREVGTTPWVFHETKVCDGATTTFIRFTSNIELPSVGRYEIRVTRTTPEYPGGTLKKDDATLSAIRSIQEGDLPSHADIAEIVLRIKATDQLNGQVDQLNAVVQQLGVTWDGTSLSAPQPIRHPAWCYINALMGPQMRSPVDPVRIALDGFKAWADEEPHWTCDLELTGKRRLAEVLDMIAATGRARRGMTDMKYSVIRDGGAGGVVQHFTPRNSWGFKGRKYLDRELHALRLRVVSESRDWQDDEIIVYADGYNAGNATEIEPMELPGVVISDGNQGNAYRIGRYHIAVAQLRSEEFSFMSDLDHLVCQMGDKVSLVHDVPLFGVGSGRVISIAGDRQSFVIDEELEVSGGTDYRIRFRSGLNIQQTVMATFASGTWTLVSGTVPLGIDVGDLTMVETMTTETVEVLITKINHEDELKAKITCLPAAPDVLTAADGTIPTYDPLITPVVAFGPPVPVVQNIRSGFDTAFVEADRSLSPRIGVQVAPASDETIGTTYLRLRWRRQGTQPWTVGDRMPYRAEVLTDRLEDFLTYDVEVIAEDAVGRNRGWISAGTAVSSTSDNLLSTPSWTGFPGIDTITLFGDEVVNFNRDKYRIYAATDASTDLTLIGSTIEPIFIFRPDPADLYTRYKVVAVDLNDDEGTYSAFINVVPAGVGLSDLGSDVADAITDADDKAQAVRDDHDALVAGYTGTLAEDFDAARLAVQSLGPYQMSLGSSYWQTITASASPGADSPHPFTGSVVTLDGSDNIAPKGVIPVSPDKIYRLEIRGKVITDDGTSGNAQMRCGFYSWDENGTLVNANIQTDMPYSVADGDFIAVKFFSGADFAGQGDRDIAAAARFIRPHIRANATGNSPGNVIEITSMSWQDNTANKRVDLLDVSFGALDATVTDMLAVDIASLPGTAFATMLTELGVSAAGVPATVTAQGVAISGLDDKASASYILRAKAGGSATDFELVAWDDADGGGTVARLNADDIILEGTVSADKLVSGTGENLIPNSDFDDGLGNLVFEQIGLAGGETTLTLRDISLSYTDRISPSLMLFQNGTETTGSADAEFGRLDVNSAFARIPVEAGQWYDFSAHVALLRCQMRVRIAWYDKDGVYISDSTSGFFDEQGSTENEPDTWPRNWVLAQAPATAKFATPFLRKFATLVGSNSYLFATKPMFAKTHADATAPTRYQANGQTIIDGGNIITDNLVVTGSMMAPNAVSDFAVTPEASGTVAPGGAIVGTSVIVTKPEGYYVRLTINGYVDGDGASTVPDRYIGFVVQVKPPGGSFINLSDFLAIPNIGGVEVWQTQSYVDIYDPTSNHGDYEFRLQITSNSATEDAGVKGSVIVEVFKK